VLSPEWKNMVSNVEGMLAQRLVILSLKKFRKDVASVDGGSSYFSNVFGLNWAIHLIHLPRLVHRLFIVIVRKLPVYLHPAYHH